MPDTFLNEGDTLFISDISYMETLGYAFADPQEKASTENLVSIIYRIPVSEDIVQKVILIRQSKRIKLPDAIIAATSIHNDCILVTRNQSDFMGIDGLSMLNPF